MYGLFIRFNGSWGLYRTFDNKKQAWRYGQSHLSWKHKVKRIRRFPQY